jgi:hypothetical protein
MLALNPYSNSIERQIILHVDMDIFLHPQRSEKAGTERASCYGRCRLKRGNEGEG